MSTKPRITDQHIAVLAAIERGENPAIQPMMRRKLVIDLKLLVPAEPRRAIRLAPGRQRAPAPRRHALTELGRQVLAAQDGAAA